LEEYEILFSAFQFDNINQREYITNLDNNPKKIIKGSNISMHCHDLLLVIPRALANIKRLCPTSVILMHVLEFYYKYNTNKIYLVTMIKLCTENVIFFK